MSFEFENGKKIGKFEPIIGKDWSKQNIRNEYLNTIFNLIDDGNNKLSEEEFDLFQRLLKKADGINSGNADSVTENSELKTLIKQIEEGEIKIDELKNVPPETLDKSLYTEEAIRKRYPESDYIIERPMSNQIIVKDKNTNRPILETIIEDDSLPRAVSTITYYDENGRETQFAVYSAINNKLESYQNKDGVRHDILPEALYEDITAKKFGIIHTTGEKLEEHLNELTKYNIDNVLIKYKELSGNTLISDIMTERGLSAQKRAELSKKIIDVYIESRNLYVGKVDLEGFKKTFYKLIDDERDGFTPMSSKKVEKLMQQLEDAQEKELDKGVYEQINGVPDGKIDSDFSQGPTGDCWFLSAVKTIMSNPQTAKLLNNQISIDRNGNVTVNLAHVDKSYTFTTEEIVRENTLASGDMDVRALEMAVKKYLNENSFSLNGIMHKIKMEDNNIEGGIPNYAYEILLGRGGILNETFYSEKPILWRESFIDEYISSGKYLVCVNCSGIFEGEESEFEVEDENGAKHKLVSIHAYAAVGADKDFVYLVNPWDSGNKLKVPRDKFLSFFGSGSVCSIDKILKKIADKYNFGDNAVINDDGKVIIYNNRSDITREKGDSISGKTKKESLSKEALAEIKKNAEKLYGKDYKVDVNKNGDILLTPLSEKP